MPRNPKHPLLNTVRELRVALGDTQQSFAQRLKLAISTVVRWELSRPPTGKALAILARAADDAGHHDLAGVFLAALAQELGLHRNVDMVQGGWNEDHTKLEGFLFLSTEGPEQLEFAESFYTAFLTVTRPESYANPPSPQTVAHARKALQALEKVTAEWRGSTKK